MGGMLAGYQSLGNHPFSRASGDHCRTSISCIAEAVKVLQYEAV